MRPRLPVVLSLALFAVVLSLASAGWLPGPPAEANASPPPRAPVTLDTTHTDVCPVDGGAPLAWPVGMVASALRVVPNAPANEYVAFGLRYNESDYANQESVGWRVDANGAPLGSPVAIGGSDHQAILPVVAFSPTSNRYLAVTSDVVNWNTEHAFPRLQARLLQPSLTPSAVNLSLGDLNPQSPAVAYDTTDDEFLVVWREERWTAPAAKRDAVAVTPTPLPTVNQGIYAQRVRTDGTPIGTPIAVTVQAGTMADGQLTSPRIQYNSHNHGYLIVWGNSRAEMFTRRIGRTGALPGAASTLFEGWGFELAYNSVDNEYLLAYLRSEGPDGPPGSREVKAYARRLTAGGAALGDEAPLPGAPGYAEIRALAYNGQANEYLIGLRDRVVRLTAQASVLGQPVPVVPDVLGIGMTDGAYLVVERWGYLARGLSFQPHCAATPTPEPGAPTPTATPSAVPALVTWQGQVQAIQPSGDGAEWTVEGQTALVTRLTRIETYAGPAGVGARVAVAAHDQNGRRVADAIVVQPSTEPPYRLYLPLVRRGE